MCDLIPKINGIEKCALEINKSTPFETEVTTILCIIISRAVEGENLLKCI